jgi:poly-gamma-glutamate capsule biosynthesis protein CapA/YwtB (metallophosphatase superfamily)
VQLAESRNGSISKPVTGSYIWGDALAELDRVAPDVRIINLETSITASDDYWKGNGHQLSNASGERGEPDRRTHCFGRTNPRTSPAR